MLKLVIFGHKYFICFDFCLSKENEFLRKRMPGSQLFLASPKHNCVATMKLLIKAALVQND